MREDAVSPVIGESLMIMLVLILVPIVTISLMNQLPEDRVQTVNIKMSPIIGDEVTFYHKGGDWVKADSIKITRNGEHIEFSYKDPVFDLGDCLTTDNVIQNGDKIAFVVKNAVIFSGVAHNEG